MADEATEALRKEVEAQRIGKQDDTRSTAAIVVSATIVSLLFAVGTFALVVATTAFVAVTYKVCAIVWSWIV